MFFTSWAPEIAHLVSITPYESIDLAEPVPAGWHVFADLERLTGGEWRFAKRFHDLLAEHPESYATINKPTEWAGRLGLQEGLTDEGINDFRAFQYDAAPDDLRFPVFLRFEHEHTGSLGGPLHSWEELRTQAAHHAGGLRRSRRRHLLVVEQLDVQSPDGYYRKYSAMKIGDQLVPRHVLFSGDWVTKHPDVVEDHLVAEEDRFIKTFEVDPALTRAFELAGLDYGRIDYGYLDGRVQIWEINTNPVLLQRGGKVDKRRRPSQRISADLMKDAFLALEASAPTGPAHRLFGPLDRARGRGRLVRSRLLDRRRR
jgi:hypothetical protein